MFANAPGSASAPEQMDARPLGHLDERLARRPERHGQHRRVEGEPEQAVCPDVDEAPIAPRGVEVVKPRAQRGLGGRAQVDPERDRPASRRTQESLTYARARERMSCIAPGTRSEERRVGTERT